MFLTETDIIALTGRKRPGAQAAFLRSRHIRHVVNKAGRVVIWSEWLTGEQKKAAPEPDFSPLKEMA